MSTFDPLAVLEALPEGWSIARYLQTYVLKDEADHLLEHADTAGKLMQILHGRYLSDWLDQDGLCKEKRELELALEAINAKLAAANKPKTDPAPLNAIEMLIHRKTQHPDGDTAGCFCNTAR